MLMLRLYALAASLIAPLLRLWLRRRAAHGKEIPARLPERRGIDPSPRPPGRMLWLHAASVGEAVSILPVIAALDGPVLLTTGTVTSAALLARLLPEQGLQDRVLHRFVPLDVPGWARRFVDHWRPDAAVFVESELWPNLLGACRARGIPTVLINARLSPRSQAAWRRVPRLAAHVLGGFAWVQARSADDAARLRALGAQAVTAPGDLKWNAPPLAADPALLAALQARLQGRPVWLAASTHPGEEARIAALHHRLAAAHPGLLTIIAPRHPERGAALATDLHAERWADGLPDGGIWLADTLGELGLLYRLCPIVFVGKSLVPPGGGQNVLEPARLGCALAVGSWTGNFEAAVTALQVAGALTRVPDDAALAAWVDGLLRDPAQARAAGLRGQRVLQGSQDLPVATAARLRLLRDGGA